MKYLVFLICFVFFQTAKSQESYDETCVQKEVDSYQQIPFFPHSKEIKDYIALTERSNINRTVKTNTETTVMLEEDKLSAKDFKGTQLWETRTWDLVLAAIGRDSLRIQDKLGIKIPKDCFDNCVENKFKEAGLELNIDGVNVTKDGLIQFTATLEQQPRRHEVIPPQIQTKNCQIATSKLQQLITDPNFKKNIKTNLNLKHHFDILMFKYKEVCQIKRRNGNAVSNHRELEIGNSLPFHANVILMLDPKTSATKNSFYVEGGYSATVRTKDYTILLNDNGEIQSLNYKTSKLESLKSENSYASISPITPDSNIILGSDALGTHSVIDISKGLISASLSDENLRYIGATSNGRLIFYDSEEKSIKEYDKSFSMTGKTILSAEPEEISISQKFVVIKNSGNSIVLNTSAAREHKEDVISISQVPCTSSNKTSSPAVQ